MSNEHNNEPAVPQNTDHFEDDLYMVAPFGYFRPEPFGWTDCAKDDEGAIALYEHPAAPAQEVATLSLSAEDVHAAFTKNFPKSRISQAWINFAADIAQAIAARAAKPAQEVTLTDEEIEELQWRAPAARNSTADDIQIRTTRQMTLFASAIIAALRAKGGK